MSAVTIGPVVWIVADLTARNALTVRQLEVGCLALVQSDGKLYPAVAAGTGVACWGASIGDSAAGDQRAFSLAEAHVAAGLLLTADKAYFTYMGFTPVSLTLNYVREHLVTAAVGTQAAEVGIFTSPAAPNRASQVLTKIAAAAVTDDLTTGAPKMIANPTALAAVVPAGSYFWAGIRANFTSTPTQPTFYALGGDMGQGSLLSTATAGALTSATTLTGATITSSTGAQGVNLLATVD